MTFDLNRAHPRLADPQVAGIRQILTETAAAMRDTSYSRHHP